MASMTVLIPNLGVIRKYCIFRIIPSLYIVSLGLPCCLSLECSIDVMGVALQEELLQGGHGLMVRGYEPVIKSLAEGLEIKLNHR